jgi:alkylhydroperoxidase family enzyme
MTKRYEDLVFRLRQAVLDGPGWTEPALRRAIAARAAAPGAGRASTEPIPADLAEFVDTVARHACSITNEDVEALRRAGYSEDEIFDIAVSAALGAGLGRLERGLAALRGEA